MPNLTFDITISLDGFGGGTRLLDDLGSGVELEGGRVVGSPAVAISPIAS